MSNLFETENKEELSIDKSELLFLYESTFSIPNGDPFTGEQRIDEETKQILISDVRIKRFIRDFLSDNGHNIYVLNDGATVSSSERMKQLKKEAGKDAKSLDILRSLIDVRLFGGISTESKDAVNLTGPVQFALLNPSLNKVDLRMHQNTSVFSSGSEKSRGAIGTTTVVPYALTQIHGWINPYTAAKTGLTQQDISLLISALWHSINLANTRTKNNQNSLLVLQVIYNDPTKKIYGLDRVIKLICGERDGNQLREEQIRSIDDYSLDFTPLVDAITNAKDVVKKVLFYSESDAIGSQLQDQPKFEKMSL